jgi:flagellar capping protein FliD
MPGIRKKKYSNNLSGLVAFIGDKFDAVNERFDTVDKRLDIVEKRLSVSEKRLDARLQELGSMFRDLQHTVDAYAKKLIPIFRRWLY